MKKRNKIIILIITIIMYIINTMLVITNKYLTIDDQVHSFIRNSANNNMDKVMKVFTFFGSGTFIVLLTLILLIVYLVKHKKNKAYIVGGAIALSTIVNNIIKLIIRRPRPEYITVVEKSFSYPSGHVMAATTLYGVIIYLISKSDLKKSLKTLYSILLVILIILVGVSRIYLGAHYFSDVFGAMILSTSLLIAIDLFNEKKKLI